MSALNIDTFFPRQVSPGERVAQTTGFGSTSFGSHPEGA